MSLQEKEESVRLVLRGQERRQRQGERRKTGRKRQATRSATGPGEGAENAYGDLTRGPAVEDGCEGGGDGTTETSWECTALTQERREGPPLRTRTVEEGG